MMVLLVCSCLNIRIHGKGTLCKTDVQNLNLPQSLLGDLFFADGIYDVTLDLAGVTMSYHSLSKIRSLEEWAITTCMCCNMEIYAENANNHDKVLVSSKTKNDPEEIHSMLVSETYSDLFKLILPEINDNFIQSNMGGELQNANIHSFIELIQSQVSNYLKEQQKSMEERISQFALREQEKYTDLLQKVRKNKQAIMYLLFKSKKSEVPVFSEAMTTNSSITLPTTYNKDSANESSTSTDSAFDISVALELSHDVKGKKQKVKTLKRTVSLCTEPSRTKPKWASSHIDAGDVFYMDEFETGNLVSSCSEEDFEESENETREDITQDPLIKQNLYSSSVPVSIPAFKTHSRCIVTDVEENEDVPRNPEEIAESMRALACSVYDGTEMFGELPRQRLNTGDLVASRPF